MVNRSEVVVVGAGLAGLVAAQQVAATGGRVIILEASSIVGGRLATIDLDERGTSAGGHGTSPSPLRRHEVGNPALADLGAQFFTVRSGPFAERVERLVADGVVYEWCRGFNEVDGYPRYAVRGGIRALAAHLAGELPGGSSELRTGRRVETVSTSPDAGREPRRWRVAGPGWELYAAAVLLTCPVPEALGLLDVETRGTLDQDLLQGMAGIGYHRVLAVAALLDRPSAIPPPGGRQLEEGPFSFVADNAAKGLSGAPVVTLHVAHDLSASLWDNPDDDALVADLLERARPWLGSARVVRSRLERWRWSGPVTPWPDRCCELAPGLLLAGDAFGGPKVEGAFLSGLEAGRRLAAPVAGSDTAR